MVGIILLNGLEEEIGRAELPFEKIDAFGRASAKFQVNVKNSGVITSVWLCAYRIGTTKRFNERLEWDAKPVSAIAGDDIDVVITISPAAQRGLAALVEPVRSIWDQLRDEP